MSSQVKAYRTIARENLKRTCIKRHLHNHEQRKLAAKLGSPVGMLAIPKEAILKVVEDMGLDVPEGLRASTHKPTH